MGVSNKSWQVYLAGKMDGLTFEEMNTWRQDAKTKIQIAADTAGYRCTIINPCDYYNQTEYRYRQTKRFVITIYVMLETVIFWS